MRKHFKKGISFVLVLTMVLSMLGVQAFAAEPPYTIVNPYENVDWDSFGSYRAGFHMHTTRSDGAATLGETALDFYNKGFDIIAVADHDSLFSGNFADGELGALTASQSAAIVAGTFGRTEYVDFAFPGDFGPELRRPENQGGMIALPFTNEQSRSEHIITLWADFNNELNWTQEDILEMTTELDGLAILAHPGRYTTGSAGGESGIASNNNPLRISRYIELLDTFPVILGFELFNRLDNETRSDRVLWDNILQELMPYGRFVWGFSNDDSHFMNQAGFNYNVLLMPELDADNARVALETGAFYMVTRVNRGVAPTDTAINTTLQDGSPIPVGGTVDTLFMLEQPTPRITRIDVAGNVIIIEGENYDRIEWVADGEIVHVGSSFHASSAPGYYVRAQLVSEYGMALTQPFGILGPNASFRSRPATNNMVSFDQPAHIYVPFGAEISPIGLRLPGTVHVVTERGWRAAATVEWDLEDLNYDPTEMEALQDFTVSGTIELPEYVTNDNDVSLTVTVEITAGVDPRISIAEANALPNGTVVTVEGFVTARRYSDGAGAGIGATSDPHRIVIQDSYEPWGGIFIQDTRPPADATIFNYVGQWVRVTGTRGPQWQQNAIHSISVEVLENDPRPPIEPVVLTMADFTERDPSMWNSMLISLEATVLERDVATNNHILAQPEGQDPLVRLIVVDLDEAVTEGSTIRIESTIVHWHANELSHRFHSNWVGGEIVLLEAGEAAPAVVYVNGEGVVGAELYTYGDSIWPTHVPLRLVARALGVGESVVWDNATRTATLVNLDGETIIATIGSSDFVVGGENVSLPAGQEAMLVNGSTFVPLRFFTDVFGMNNSFFESGRVIIDNEEIVQ